ncbi:cytosolic non-specific dipeptidase-like isoform X2 [Lycorma delicatula]|uniref:cytosolic non-specific dipeptidase-like isoform X2 n=1 Tax=Lycorma delicatula TaxID=130591 RepID=UPI003F51922C
MSKTNDIPEILQQIFRFIDENKNNCIDKLRKAVSIRSVSFETSKKEELVTMAYWFAEQLRYIGVTVEIANPGLQTLQNGTSIELPPIILGEICSNPNNKTVLFVGHYNVLPANIEDGWISDPFTLVKKGELLVGRGVVELKGPCIIWICAIEAYLNVNGKLPVNFKFLVEGMSDFGSTEMKKIIQEKSFFKNVNFICSCDSYWISRKTPCICYSHRGIIWIIIEIECCKRDLHGGIHGGTIIEAMPDMAYMLDGLIGEHGYLLIPGIYDAVDPVTNEEKKSFNKINFDVNLYVSQTGSNLLTNDKMSLLMARWRFPSLTIHGIEEALSDKGENFVIPKKINLKIEENPWITTYHNQNYSAAIAATQMVYNVKPDMIHSGNTPLHLNDLENATFGSVISFPLVPSHIGAYSQNESLHTKNFIDAIKVVTAYLHQLATEEIL